MVRIRPCLEMRMDDKDACVPGTHWYLFMRKKTNALSSLAMEGIERCYPTASKEAGMHVG